MDFDQACAITASVAAGDHRRLQRDLDGWTEAHRSETRMRLALAGDEFDQDLGRLTGVAGALHQAGLAVAMAIDRLADNNLSITAPAPDAAEVCARFDEALDGLLLPSAARVVSADLALRLGG